MRIESIIEPVNGVYIAQIGLPAANGLTPVELDAFIRFGEPLVQCGGTFTAGQLTFTLPTAERLLPSQFPVTARFSLEDFEDALARAELFISTMTTRLTAARDTRVEVTPGAIGQSITIV